MLYSPIKLRTYLATKALCLFAYLLKILTGMLRVGLFPMPTSFSGHPLQHLLLSMGSINA